MAPREMRGYEFACFGERGARVQENQHGWAGAAEGYAKDSFFAFELLKRRKQRAEWGAVGLVNAVFQGDGEQVRTALGEGGEQQHGILHVGDGVGAGILRGE